MSRITESLQLVFPTGRGIVTGSMPAGLHFNIWLALGDYSNTIAVNERAIKAVGELYAGRGKGASLASASRTAWGLVNSVTEFADHHRRARPARHQATLDG